MNAHPTTPQTHPFASRTQRYLVAAGGAALALTVATGLVVGLGRGAERPAVTTSGASTRPTNAGALDLGAAQRPIPSAIYEQVGSAAAPEQQRPIPVLVYRSLGSPAVAEARHQPI